MILENIVLFELTQSTMQMLKRVIQPILPRNAPTPTKKVCRRRVSGSVAHIRKVGMIVIT